MEMDDNKQFINNQINAETQTIVQKINIRDTKFERFYNKIKLCKQPFPIKDFKQKNQTK